MGQSQGTAMHSGNEQGSLWEQSDLLELVTATQAPAQPSQPPATPPPGAAMKADADGTALPVHQPSSRSQHTGAAIAAWPPASLAATEEPEDPRHGEAPPADARGHREEAEASDRAAAASPAEIHSPLTKRSPSLPPLPGLSDTPALPTCPERLLILDTETTALSPQQGQCIEVGAVLFDVTSRSVLMQVSFLLPCDRNPAQAINGIPAAVSRLEQPWRSGLACFEAMVADADAVLAHNAAFDRQWFGNGELPALCKPWICSMEDIRWPAERQLRPTPSVRDLALAYGVPVWAAHRALTDCIYLVQVFQRCDELEALLQAALEPRRLVRARLSYDERQLAKDAGFRWNEPVPKAWSRRLSEREIAALPFPVDPVEAEEPARPRGELPAPQWRRSA
jgi:DNA polymerase-3 subunit epsilon